MKLVNPVHLFNEVGTSLLTENYLKERIQELEDENAELQDKVLRLTDRLKHLAKPTSDRELAS